MLLATGSYVSLFAIFMTAFAVLAPANASTFAMNDSATNAGEAGFETAAYATYTPQMAARGQRFYVGP